MFLKMSGFGIAAPLLMAAGALFGLTGQAAANEGNGPDVSFGIWIGSGWRWEPGCHVPPRSRDCDYAGTLTIDGRSFRIDTSCSVRSQIREAFEYMGYDAWYVGGSVRVHKDHCGPEVCWRTGEYSISFRERRTTITITPFQNCHEHDRGCGYRYGYSREHGRYFAYSEVQGAGGGNEWRSMGVSTFVESDHDLDDELRIDDRREPRVGDRTDDRFEGRESGERRVADRRTTPDAGRIDHRTRVDERSSVPTSRRSPADAGRGTVRDDTRHSAPAGKPASKSPADLKRSPERRDEMRTMPADRLGGVKRTERETAPKDLAPMPKGSAKKDVSATTSKGESRKSKW